MVGHEVINITGVNGQSCDLWVSDNHPAEAAGFRIYLACGYDCEGGHPRGELTGAAAVSAHWVCGMELRNGWHVVFVLSQRTIRLQDTQGKYTHMMVWFEFTGLIKNHAS